MSSHTQQMWLGCPWYCYCLAFLPSGGWCQGEGSASRRNPSNPTRAEEILGFPIGHLTLSCRQIPGAHSKMLIPQPMQGGWDRAQEPILLQLLKPQSLSSACLAASRGLASLPQGLRPHALSLSAEVSSLCFWSQVHVRLLTLPGSCRTEGGPQANPGALCLALPPLPSHLLSTHPKAHSPHGICPPPLTSSDSAAACPRPASQIPPRLPPSSLPIS